MANEDTFLLLSLEEKRSKELAQVISNETSRKILDYLSKHDDATESQLAKELNIPLPTIHYNIQNLLKAKLIESKEYEWSEKGKKVSYYKLAKKLIVIAPKTSETLINQLKKIFPIALITIIAAAIINFFTRFNNQVVLEKTFADASKKALEKTSQGFYEESMAQSEIANKTSSLIAHPSLISIEAKWFILGAIFVIILILISVLIKKRK